MAIRPDTTPGIRNFPAARTTRLVLIDPWLSDTGGHNFQYALDIAQAAQQRGYDVVLAVHQRLPDSLRFDPSWRVLRLYRFGPCGRHWLGPVGRSMQPCDLDGNRLEWRGVTPAAGKGFARSVSVGVQDLLRGLRDRPAAWDRRRRIRDFALNSSRLLDEIAPQPGDLFFLPSMSEFDFLGVIRFLRDDPRTLDFGWHLQFHFNVFEGRDPEFAEQTARLERFRRQLIAAAQQVPQHRLHYYATTPAMARQFDHVGIGHFQPLPYPVRRLYSPVAGDRADLPSADDHAAQRPASANPDGRPRLSPVHGGSLAKPDQRPLRVTFAGAMRREKGKKRLGTLIAAVWDDCLANGRMQFVFQAKRRQIAGWLPRDLRPTARIEPLGNGYPGAPLQTAPYPLDAESYASLIQQSDLGVFLYDSRRYYARASGILCEMLAAAVPVIVPAGCWLADQISQAHGEHAQQLVRHASQLGTYRLPLQPLGKAAQAGEQLLPEGVSDIVVQWPWPERWPAGVYVRLKALFTNRAGTDTGAADERVVGPPEREAGGDATAPMASRSEAGVVVAIPVGANRVRLIVESAYGCEQLGIDEVTITALKPPSAASHHPAGRVGLIAASEDQVPALIREMLQHYDHYRAGAVEFSSGWLERHHAARTIELLVR